MANLNDIFASTVFGGARRGLLLPKQVEQMVRARQNTGQIGFDISEPMIDEVWAGDVPSSAPHNYFDYFFSSQDIRVFVDGTIFEAEFNQLPLMQLGFNVTQEKKPVYGYWSYTYDGVMRGTRIINGQITIATKAPDYMRSLLTRAAEIRKNTGQGSYYYPKGLTEDDLNIDKYWGRNIDPAITTAGKNIFSVHPPFSLVIVYGVQSISVNPNYQPQRIALYDQYAEDTPLLADTNERLVDSDSNDHATRIILDGIELTDMSTGYGTDGSVIAETYSFFARDIVIPSRTGGAESAPSQINVPISHSTGG